MVQLWREYLVNSEMSFVEYDKTCAEQWQKDVEKKARGKLYIGDQSDTAFLQSVIDDQAGKLFDVVIDDGGHTMIQQRTTLKYLWQVVAPGGIFVMEDLLTSYFPQYGGGPKGTPDTMIDMQKDLIDELNCRFHSQCASLLPGLLDMDCYEEACVMTKRD